MMKKDQVKINSKGPHPRIQETTSSTIFMKTFEKDAPLRIKEALEDLHWLMTLQEKLNHFKEMNWIIDGKIKYKVMIGIIFIFQSKQDMDGTWLTSLKNKMNFKLKKPSVKIK